MNYRNEVHRTFVTKNNFHAIQHGPQASNWGDVLSLCALGLAGETGETVDMVKKFLFHGKPLDREKLIKELGDVRWYLEAFSIALGVPMSDIERANIEKLRARFPNGFNYQDANIRKDEVTP